jgi:hypothetical protein
MKKGGELMESKNFLKFCIPTFLIIMMFGALSPTLACSTPHSQTYSFVAIGYPQDPGEKTIVNDILYVKGSVGIGVDYGYPWGNATHTQTSYFFLNQTSYAGKLVGYVEKTFAKGTATLIGTAEFAGVGSYTYHGPTITAKGTDASGNSIFVQITDGMQFFGLPYTGGSNGYAMIRNTLYVVTEKMTGVSIVGGPLNGVGIVVGTGTYKTMR